MIARHILRENPDNYDKGALSLVLEDIMGKGLIPADYETWKNRRRAIAPGFHKLYLTRMVSEFGQANANLIPQLLKAAQEGRVLDMEERYGSLALDVIGKAVFNYEFGSVNEESPVVKAAIRTLGEVEHRALTPAPYWKIPGANDLVPRLKEFNKDMDLLNSVLYRRAALARPRMPAPAPPARLPPGRASHASCSAPPPSACFPVPLPLHRRGSVRPSPARSLIDKCLESRNPEELEDLKNKDYSKVTDPSMLRFLVDLRGEEVDNTQMRDDLITLLIAGHETTAAVLTWMTYALSKVTPHALDCPPARPSSRPGQPPLLCRRRRALTPG